VLHMAGDIDMLTLPLVCAALTTALNTQPADLVVDLSQVRFCGVRGFVLLAAMARTTATRGIGYAVAGMGPHLDRAATQAWSGHRLHRHPNTAAAVTATRRGQARARRSGVIEDGPPAGTNDSNRTHPSSWNRAAVTLSRSTTS
jgi:anti-anti-sigma factor